MRTFLLRVLALMAFAVFAFDTFSALQQIGKPYPGFQTQDHLYFQNQEKGLTVWSKLESANGVPLTSNADLRRFVASVPAGTLVSYGYHDKGKAETLMARRTVFGWGNFVRDLLPFLLVAVPFFIVGAVSFFLRPDSPAARAHLLLTFFLGASQSLYVEWFEGSLLKEWIEPIAISIVFLQGAALVHLALVFPSERPLLRRFPWALALLYGFAGLLCLNGYSHFFAQYLRDGTIDVPVQETFGWTLAAWVTATYLIGYGALGEAMFRAPGHLARRQARVALLGVFLSALPLFFLDLGPSQLGLRVPYTPWLAVLSVAMPVLFPLAVAYAILRHKMFDIDLVLKRTVVYTVVLGGLAALYFAVLSGLGFLLVALAPGLPIHAAAGSDHQVFAKILATAAVAVGFDPLHRRTRAFVDARFFRGSYTFDRVVAEFGDLLRGDGREAKAMLGAFLVTMGKALHPEYLAALFRPSGAQELVLVESVGLSHLDGMVIPLDHPVIRAVSEANAAVAAAPGDFGPLQKALLLPLYVSGQMVGAVLTGPRKSGLEYDDQDRLLLATLAGQFEKRLEQDEVDRTDAEAERARTVLSRYVSSQVAETVLHEHFDIRDGRRQEVTLMFTDIRGFTKMSETMAPEEVVSLLNAYFSRMVRSVFEFDGMLDKYIGDGMMVVFGAPLPRADHAWRAVQAAVLMREELALFNAERSAAGQSPLKIGIGLHSGECVVGNIGADQRLDFTAIGDTVNTASRIEGLTKDHGVDILISATTYAHVRDRVAARAIPGVTIRGKERPLDLYTLEGLAPATQCDAVCPDP